MGTSVGGNEVIERRHFFGAFVLGKPEAVNLDQVLAQNADQGNRPRRVHDDHAISNRELFRVRRELAHTQDRVISLGRSLISCQLADEVAPPGRMVLAVIDDGAALAAVVDNGVADVGAGIAAAYPLDPIFLELRLEFIEQLDLGALAQLLRCLLLKLTSEVADLRGQRLLLGGVDSVPPVQFVGMILLERLAGFLDAARDRVFLLGFCSSHTSQARGRVSRSASSICPASPLHGCGFGPQGQ